MICSLIGWTFGLLFAGKDGGAPWRQAVKTGLVTAISKEGGIAMATSKKAKKTNRKLTAKKLEETKPLVVPGGWNRVKN